MGIEKKTELPAMYKAALECKGPMAEIQRALDKYLGIYRQFKEGTIGEEAVQTALSEYKQVADMYKGWNE